MTDIKIETYEDILDILLSVEDDLGERQLVAKGNGERASMQHSGKLLTSEKQFNSQELAYSKLKAKIRAIRDVMLQHKPSQSRPVPELSKVARSFEELEGYDNV